MYICIYLYINISSGFLRLVNICRAHTVLARSKKEEAQNFLKKKFSVSLEKVLQFCFHIYFSASFVFYFLVADT